MYTDNQSYLNKFTTYLFVACALPLIFSCETSRDIEIPREPDVIVLGGRFSVDSVLSVTISKSKFILIPDLNFQVSLKDATINILEGNTVVDRLVLSTSQYNNTDELPTLFISSSDLIPEAGKTYNIEVHSEGFSSLYATTTVPQKVMVNSMTFDNKEIEITAGFSVFPVSIEFNDPPDQTNYYRVEAFFNTLSVADGKAYEDGGSLSVASELSQGRDLTNNNIEFPGLYFSDINFNGQKVKFDFFIESFILRDFFGPPGVIDIGVDTVSMELSIVLKHITKEHCDFGVTADLQDEVSNDPFAEPVSLKSNVVGGLGIFAGYNYDISSQDITDEILN